MDKYAVMLTNRALQDLDGIYTYIAKNLLEPGIALKLVDEIEAAVLSLDEMPHRCPERQVGAYAGRGYRQLIVKNYTAIYRVDDESNQVIVITVRYAPSQF